MRAAVIRALIFDVRSTAPDTSGLRGAIVDIAAGDGPGKFLVALGYAGWGSGQLESEIAANAWLSVPAAGSISCTRW